MNTELIRLASASERSKAAQRLLSQSNDSGLIELVTVSGMQLCALGGPRHVLFDEAVARMWTGLDSGYRAKLIQLVTEGMIDAGMFIERTEFETVGWSADAYSLNPALGLVLAARCRPAYVIVTEVAGQSLRTLRFFALGDLDEPARALVAEIPTVPPANEFTRLNKFGPLGWLYRYVLASPATAVNMLTEWALTPLPPQSSARVVSAFRNRDAGQSAIRIGLRLRGDGSKVRLLDLDENGVDHVIAEHGPAGLRGILSDFLTLAAR